MFLKMSDAKVTPLYKKAESDKATWVRVLPEGLMEYKGQRVEYTKADLKAIAEDTNRLIRNSRKYAEEGLIKMAADGIEAEATPWHPPFLREHGKAANGQTTGTKMLEARATGNNLWALMAWSDDDHTLVMSDRIEFVSPGIRYNFTDFKGERYAAVLWEISATTHPKRKDIGRIQDTLDVRLSDNETITINLAEANDMEELLNKMLGMLEAMNTKIDKMNASEDGEGEEVEASDNDGADPSPPDVQASDDDAEAKIVELSDKVEQLQSAIVRMSEANAASKKPLTDEPGNDGRPPANIPAELTEDYLAALEEEHGHEKAMAMSFKHFS